jgi:hypothetical protein
LFCLEVKFNTKKSYPLLAAVAGQLLFENLTQSFD